jgi:hypothetical protein
MKTSPAETTQHSQPAGPGKRHPTCLEQAGFRHVTIITPLAGEPMNAVVGARD